MALALLSMSSCQRANYYSRSVEANTVEPNYHNVMTTPLAVDLEVSDTKITYTERDAFLQIPNIKNVYYNQSLRERCRQIALALAAKANNADIIVAPNVEMETDANGNLTVTVMGYPATYRNFRKPTVDDIELIYRSWHAIDELILPVEYVEKEEVVTTVETVIEEKQQPTKPRKSKNVRRTGK